MKWLKAWLSALFSETFESRYDRYISGAERLHGESKRGMMNEPKRESRVEQSKRMYGEIHKGDTIYTPYGSETGGGIFVEKIKSEWRALERMEAGAPYWIAGVKAH